jgi:hypothetical protein
MSGKLQVNTGKVPGFEITNKIIPHTTQTK